MKPDDQSSADLKKTPSENPEQNKAVKIKRPRSNIQSSQKIIKELEGILSTRIICYFIDSSSEISYTHADLFIDHLKNIGKKDSLSLVLVSSGGDSSTSLRIATIMREYCDNLVVYVPSICASAATVLALSANKIIMSPSGFLTSIDSSIRHPLNPKDPDGKPVFVSVDQVNRALNFIKQEEDKLEKQKGPYLTLFEYVHPLALGAIDRYSSASELIAYKMMNMHPGSFQGEEDTARIAKHLVIGYPAHSFPILYDEAKKIGLPVEKVESEVADMLRSLVKTYNVATMPSTTHLASTYFRFESMPVVIESSGMRTSYRHMYFKRVNPATKTWQIEDNNSQWVNIYPPEEGEKLAKMVPIDAPFPDQPVQHNQENPVKPVLTEDSEKNQTSINRPATTPPYSPGIQ